MQAVVRKAWSLFWTMVAAVAKFVFCFLSWFVGACLVGAGVGTAIAWRLSNTSPQYFSEETWALIGTVSVFIALIIAGVAALCYLIRKAWNGAGYADQSIARNSKRLFALTKKVPSRRQRRKLGTLHLLSPHSPQWPPDERAG
jgi:hypothetical protein